MHGFDGVRLRNRRKPLILPVPDDGTRSFPIFYPKLRRRSGPETASPDADVWRERTDDWLKKAGAAFCAGALAMVRRCGWPIRDAGRAQRMRLLAARSRPIAVG